MKEKQEGGDLEIKRLQTDLKGSQVLITTLQKESERQAQQRSSNIERDKGSIFNRHQKKLKELKQKVNQLQEANSAMRVDLEVTSKKLADYEAAEKKKSKKWAIPQRFFFYPITFEINEFYFTWLDLGSTIMVY